MSPAMGPETAADEHARIFHEAQRSADTIFSHYQLSQLLATHALPDSMAQAVLDELVHVCGAGGGAIWLARSPGELRLAARAGAPDPPSAPPDIDGQAGEAGPWLRVELEDVGIVALAPDPARPIDVAARRFLSLVRHDLAIALRGALLRETLERERAELAAIVQNASDAIVLVDADRRVTRVNPAAERMLHRGAAGVIGETCDRALRCELVGEPPRACAGRCPFERVLLGGEPLDGVERSIVASNGEETPVVGSYSALARSVEGRAQAVAILRDTSEIARLAELRRGFLGNVSHELRTPLALIKGYVETLLDLDPDPATARAYLRRIDDTADRLTGLVRQILDASQLAADHLELDLAPLDLEGLMRGAATELAVRVPELQVRLDVSREIPPLRGDRERLRQVLDNLLANAAKYGSPSDGVDVRASVEDGVAIISIADHGVGIPDDERELVFEQFHRGRNVRERNVPGSGLGLAISRRIVEAHGGTLAFDPDRLDGAMIVVRLPLDLARIEGEPVLAAPGGEPS